MLIDELKAASIEALKTKDNVTRGILSVVITRYKNLEIEMKSQGKEISDKELISIIQKVLRELADEKEGYLKVGNNSRADDITKQEAVLSKYLPKQLSEQEIRDIIAGLDDKSVPAVMKYFKTNYAGQVDMSLVNSVLRSL